MDTTENNDKLQKLQMLKQEKQSLEKKLSKVDIWVYPLSFIIMIVTFNLFDFSEVTANRIFVALIIILLPFWGYAIVKEES